jgi:hypothetical protein
MDYSIDTKLNVNPAIEKPGLINNKWGRYKYANSRNNGTNV